MEQDATIIEEIVPAETYDCDVVICGAGLTGLAAAVEAAYGGAKVIMLESAAVAGGNGRIMGGLFARNSPYQIEQGIDFTLEDFLDMEMDSSQYRVDGQLWIDIYEKSGENMRWLMDQGVEFSGEVTDYGTGGLQSMHWFKGQKGFQGYVPAMVRKAEELGVEIIYSAKAEHPVTVDGRVAGILARRESGEWIQVDAKAVILATGGFGANKEMVARIGYDPDNLWYFGAPTNDGGGWRIAMELGGRDFSYNAADNAHSYTHALPHEGPVDMPNCGMGMCGYIVWVNQDAKRFVREDCGFNNFCLQNPPRWNQREWYFVWDSVAWEKLCEMYGVPAEEGARILAEGVEKNEGGTLFMSDTIEGVAEPFGLDGEALKAEIEAYNQGCEEGVDHPWQKDPRWLTPLNHPPYYINRPETLFLMTIGAVATDRNAQVLDERNRPIEGLYAVGVDGCMQYRNVYTINAPGSCSAGGINMARTAARHICAKLNDGE